MLRHDDGDQRQEVEAASDRQLQSRFEGTAWVRCESWYREGGNGRIVANWPGYMREYQRAVTRLYPGDYELMYASGAEPVEA